jgi:hypothetical protein
MIDCGSSVFLGLREDKSASEVFGTKFPRQSPSLVFYTLNCLGLAPQLTDSPILFLFMANPEHLALLQQGAAIWNELRTRNPGLSPDLCEADLTGEPPRAKLKEAVFCGAKPIWTSGPPGQSLSKHLQTGEVVHPLYRAAKSCPSKSLTNRSSILCAWLNSVAAF